MLKLNWNKENAQQKYGTTALPLALRCKTYDVAMVFNLKIPSF